MLLTRSKLLSTAPSNHRASLPSRPASLSNPVANPASTSKSCTCTQLLAPPTNAASRATGAAISDGATVSTTSGRQLSPVHTAGNSAVAAKLA